ncbi:hypothetical protein CTAM01_14218 [Colletotrichum tamarilloi]|uniref:Uncharacterized protein n=1 Tax=Colletotrichum tamarilloi TaxID=1209934 RepID=A0ABQ9QPU3_9PEZI|nr:uncharacterized protein CTAM01_14218 [Colletotrichum tamarilloi]KAK1480759.1 hypothetical protein CTAM01_14218 [Colletotrichum tamarilloi]
MAGNGVGGAAPVSVLGSGIRYLGFSGLLVCPRRSSQSLGLGGLSIPCPPSRQLGSS